MYSLMTEGSLPPDSPALPPPRNSVDSWELTCPPLRSAYKAALGAEPEFTNYTHSVNGPFIGTLDYVFVSDGVAVRSVDPLPVKADAEPSPSENVPSDHWPIAANLEFTS